MRNLDPEIKLQSFLHQQILDAMQADVLQQVKELCGSDQEDLFLHSAMKGNHLQVRPEILPDVYNLCIGVKEALEFDEDIDFYIVGTHDVNASAYRSESEGSPHLIQINAGLFNLMSYDELKFIIGHEIGHLINNDGKIKRLFYFLFPEEEGEEEGKAPEFLLNRFKLYNQLAELSADRYGYMGCQNLDACVTAIFKMASGLHLDKMNIQISDLLDHNSQSLNFLLTQHIQHDGSHPLNPVRIEGLHLFVKAKTQKALNEGMDTLLETITSRFFNAFDETYAIFKACAGLYICAENGKLDKMEENFILQEIAKHELYPSDLLKRASKADYMGIMHSKMDEMIEIEPEKRGEILSYLIGLMLSDNKIDPEELNKIYLLGEDMNIDRELINLVIADAIREDFIPQAKSMK